MLKDKFMGKVCVAVGKALIFKPNGFQSSHQLF